MEWVTDLRNKYRYEPFFRTEWNVIFLQAIFALLILLFVWLAFNYLYKDITRTLIEGITDIITQKEGVTGEGLIASVREIKTRNFVSILVIILAIASMIGYIIARVTLSPARNALASQKRFISDIAHELRTPLTVIKTNSEVTLLDTSLDPKIKKVFESTIEELDRTSEIINNLLSFNNWMRSERIPFRNVYMGAVVDAAVKKLRGLAEAKKLSIAIRKKNPNSVWGNQGGLEQIVINLLKNAISYTAEGGHISITLQPDYRGNVVLTIADTGVGIPHKDLFHIFEPFYRGEQSRNRTNGSSGLGLTIVSELVKLHRGKITIKSIEQQGTTVIVLLPYSEDEVTLLPKENQEDEISIDFHPRT